MERKIKFVCNAVRWNDRVNGNTYHSVRIDKMKDGKQLKSSPMVCGYEDQYRYTALEIMAKNKWIPKKYLDRPNGGNLLGMYERENNYPIIWNVIDGLKRDMINNVS